MRTRTHRGGTRAEAPAVGFRPVTRWSRATRWRLLPAVGQIRQVSGVTATPEGSFREAPEQWAKALGISREAMDLYLACDVIDLHVDSFIWTRVFGYDIHRSHGRGWHTGAWCGQVDLPRLLQAELSATTWVITTNPLRSRLGLARTYERNLNRLRGLLAKHPRVQVVRDLPEYRQARAEGKHAVFLAVQGGNALSGAEDLPSLLQSGWLTRATLVHLTNSHVGATSSPLALGCKSLGAEGAALVAQLNAARVFVDLAHLHPAAVDDALALHDRSLPPLVTHTGVSGVHPHWRNLSDKHLRAVAERGGTVGVMFHSPFLGDRTWHGRASTILRHLQYIVDTVGDCHASLGSDWDGAIVTPRDMPTCVELPRLVQLALHAGWNEERVRRVLGGNFLRCLDALRPARSAQLPETPLAEPRAR